MTAEEYYERTGWVANVVFPTGALVRGKDLEIYYGASDTHCCTARVNLEQLIKSIDPKAKPLFKRYAGNPIITPRPDKSWEARGTLNAASIEIDKTIHLLYRAAADDDMSTFGYASTKDGFKIDKRSDNPIYIPREDFESRHQAGNCGCEDPRLVEIKGTIYMTYTAYDGHVPRVAVSTISKEDFKKNLWDKWSKPVLITDGNVANKDSTIIPEKGAKGYVIFHRVNESICAEIFPNLDFSKQKVNRCIEMISPRPGMWDGRKVGIAAPAIKTKKGWLMFYHGISETGTYRVGMVLLDKKDPTIVLSRSALPVFEPKENYELNGVVSRVVFPCGVINRKGTIYLYYGGADYVLGVATAKLDELLATLTK